MNPGTQGNRPPLGIHPSFRLNARAVEELASGRFLCLVTVLASPPRLLPVCSPFLMAEDRCRKERGKAGQSCR